MIKKIAILGDFNPAYSTHHALNDSVRMMQKLFDEEIQFDWIATDIFRTETAFGKNIYAGLWIAPGSPYKDMQNVLNTIRYVRENNIPTLGNCGGFQHMVIEYAQNVCGITHASHAEVDPGAAEQVITPLACSLVEQEEMLKLTGRSSQLYNIMQQDELKGKYYCSYGLNENYKNILEANGMDFTAVSADGMTRAFELKNHPFFLGTLFQPALTSSADNPNPILLEFIKRSIT